MEKVYKTFQFFVSFVFCFAVLTTVSYGQSTSCTLPLAEDFQGTTGNNTAGFTGQFSRGTQGQRIFLERTSVTSGGVYSITTPTYQLPNNATNVGYGFLLDGNTTVSSVTAKIQYTSTVTGQVETVTIATFTPIYNQQGVSDVCRTVAISELNGFPGADRRYRLILEFTAGGSVPNNPRIIFDDFRTNGTAALAALPVTFIRFEAQKSNNNILLTWQIAGEENVDRYEVERSADGRVFSTIGSIKSHGKDTYTFTDRANIGIAYYRVRNMDIDGKFKYTNVLRMANDKSSIQLRAFPQPVTNQLTLQHSSIEGAARISISSADGRIIKTIIPASHSLQTSVDMNNLQKGLYLIRIDAGNGTVETLKILKQ